MLEILVCKMFLVNVHSVFSDSYDSMAETRKNGNKFY